MVPPAQASRPGIVDREYEFEPTVQMRAVSDSSDDSPQASTTHDRPLVASKSRSGVESFDAGTLNPPAPRPINNREYLRRLEPMRSGRSIPAFVLPILGLAAIIAGVLVLIQLRSGGDDLSAGGLVNPTTDQMAQATVQIQGLDANGTALCTGSGSFVSTDGLILTNAHVITRDAACNFTRVGVAVTTNVNQRPELRYEADLLVVDTQLDLAVIKVARTIDPNQSLPSSFLAFTLGDSDTLTIGDSLRVLGYPEIGGETITFTTGSVGGFTAQAGIGDRAIIKTSTTIAGGNSGGAAVDTAGKLVAIPTKARATESGPAVDCRPMADTNRDGDVDSSDNCIPIGGFLNGLRPINLARDVIERAHKAEPITFAAPDLGQPVDPGSVLMSQPRFSLGEDNNNPVDVIRTSEAGINRLCLFVDWAGMPDKAPWDAVWFVNKKPMDQYSLVRQSWTFGPEGANFWVCAIDEIKGLPAGLYELGFFVSGQLIFSEGIVLTSQPVAVHSTTWRNSTDSDLCSLAINPRGSGPVGLNELPPGEMIEPDGTATIDLPEGDYVVEARDCNNEPVADSGGEDDGAVVVSDESMTFSIAPPT